MGVKIDNLYRLTHRQPGQKTPDRGVRFHNGRRGIDVEDLFNEEADVTLEAAALAGLVPFIRQIRILAPKVCAVLNDDAFDDLRALFLDDGG